MRNSFAALCLGTIVATSAFAAEAGVAAGWRDAGARWRGNMQFHSLPFPRSERAAAIWNERACWSECGAHNAWGFAPCLHYDAQGRCLRRADRVDRSCQRECRTLGGPLVSGLFFD